MSLEEAELELAEDLVSFVLFFFYVPVGFSSTVRHIRFGCMRV